MDSATTERPAARLASRTTVASRCRKTNGQIAHDTILSKIARSQEVLTNLAIGCCTGPSPHQNERFSHGQLFGLPARGRGFLVNVLGSIEAACAEIGSG